MPALLPRVFLCWPPRGLAFHDFAELSPDALDWLASILGLPLTTTIRRRGTLASLFVVVARRLAPSEGQQLQLFGAGGHCTPAGTRIRQRRVMQLQHNMMMSACHIGPDRQPFSTAHVRHRAQDPATALRKPHPSPQFGGFQASNHPRP